MTPKTLVEFESHVQLFATLGVLYSPPDSSVQGILQARILSGLPCPSPGDLPDPGIKCGSLMTPVLAGGFFTTCASWEA